MKIYEIMFLEMNGERGYGDVHLVISLSLREARLYADKMLAEYFGKEETDRVDDIWVTNGNGEYAAKVVYVKEITETKVPNTRGSMGTIKLTIKQEGP